jgi:hypothetical protein
MGSGLQEAAQSFLSMQAVASRPSLNRLYYDITRMALYHVNSEGEPVMERRIKRDSLLKVTRAAAEEAVGGRIS